MLQSAKEIKTHFRNNHSFSFSLLPTDYSLQLSSLHRFPASPIPRFLVFLLFPILLFTQLTTIPFARAGDEPFKNAANWGGTGLIEIPNARILEDGEVRFGVSQALPYRWYSPGIGILPGFELTGRLTQMTNAPTQYDWSYLDRAFDIKYQLLQESRSFPAVAIGAQDFWGTRLFPSEYIALSRQVFPFDITCGLGSKRLKGLSIPFMGSVGLFGGVELALNDRLHFITEYNPIKYEKDKGSAGRVIPDGAKSKVNVGIRAKILPGFDLGLSYQRGDTLGVKFHIKTNLGEPILSQKPDPPLKVSVDRRSFDKRDHHEIISEIHDAILELDFSDVLVHTNGKDIIAEVQNNQYFSNQKAAGRVLRILLFHSPSDTEKIKVVLKKRDMPILKVSVQPEHFEKYLLGKIPDDIFYSKLIKIDTARYAIDSQDTGFSHTEPDQEKRYQLGIKPDFTTFWLDGSNYVQVRPGAKPNMTARLWKGALAYVRYDVPLYSNIYSSAGPSPNPVRTDLADFMGRNYSFDRLIVNQTLRLYERTFSRVSFGYFEKMYAGIGGETLSFFNEGKLALGIEADWVVKRNSESQFGFVDFRRHSVLGNAYYFYPGLDLTFHGQYGRFLAGDVGWMLDINRQYHTGVTLGLFYSFTDTSIFNDRYNTDYNHKGVYLNLPFKMFLTRDSRQMLNYGISPWTRDVAATVFHWQDLYGIGKDLLPARFKSKVDEIKE